MGSPILLAAYDKYLENLINPKFILIYMRDPAYTKPPAPSMTPNGK